MFKFQHRQLEGRKKLKEQLGLKSPFTWWTDGWVNTINYDPDNQTTTGTVTITSTNSGYWDVWYENPISIDYSDYFYKAKPTFRKDKYETPRNQKLSNSYNKTSKVKRFTNFVKTRF